MRPALALGWLALGWLAVAIAGCAAPPETSYYQLAPAVSGEATPVSPDPSEATLTITLPAVLDRSEIVEETGPQTVRVREFERWAAPLDEMVPSVLARDLAAAERGDATPDSRHFVIGIDNFTFGDDGIVRLDGTWSVRPDEAARPGRRWRFSFRATTDPRQVPAAVASMSGLLARLAAAMASAS